MANKNAKAEQLQSLNAIKDFQYLLNEAYKILGNPILMHDMDYKMITCTDNIVTDDPIWNEFVTTGTVSLTRIEFYKDESFLDIASYAKKATYLRSDKLKYDRMYAKLFNRDNIQIGCAIIVESHTPFDDDDLPLFELFCGILNKALAKSDYYKDYGQSYQEFLVNKLIDGGIEDREAYTAHIESIYINLNVCLRLAVVDISRCEGADNSPAFFRDLFKRTRPDFKYSIYGSHVVAIMSYEEATHNIKHDLTKFDKLFKQNNISAGISGCFENLFELDIFYNEAVKALNYGLNLSGDKQIFLYDEIKHDTNEQ